MSTEEERKDLITTPLPPEQMVMTPEDLTLPLRIREQDMHIECLKKTLLLAQEARAALLHRAVTLGVKSVDLITGETVFIKKKERNLPREINMELFQKEYPVEYNLCLKDEVDDAKDKAQKAIDAISEAGMTIRIGTAQRHLQEIQVDKVCFPHKITTTYEVITTKKK